MKTAQRVALGGIMCALGVVLMCLGTVIPIGTYACPAFAAIALLPVLEECGARYALSTYAATALLSLLFAPDREAALLYAFLGYYPVLKPLLDRHLRQKPIRILVKLLICNAAWGITLVTAVYLLGMQQIVAEYAELTPIFLIIFWIICNATMLLYDRLYGSLTLLYRHRLRYTLFRFR